MTDQLEGGLKGKPITQSECDELDSLYWQWVERIGYEGIYS